MINLLDGVHETPLFRFKPQHRDATIIMKIYQPLRKDLLINTQWGIPRHLLKKEEAKLQGRKLFLSHWATAEEIKLLKDQRHVYLSIRGFAIFFLLMPIWILIGFMLAHQEISDYHTFLVFAVFFCTVSVISGLGLLSYNRWARTLALLVLIPLTPVLIGLIGLYDLYCKAAEQIFTHPIKS